ncbi:MAG: hypothetical protein P4M13_07015 [Alphaproteobacteria bacterium]|nr:hypothetical protein [Alphaproteobacteria bacterium]
MKYISAVEAISLLAYDNTETLSKILDTPPIYYQKWKVLDFENLRASCQRLSRGLKAKGEMDVYAASLVAMLKRPAQELLVELEQDMRAMEKCTYDEARIVKAQKIFIEAISGGQLAIYGVRQGGNGNSEEIPAEFARRQDYGINIWDNICENSFCFKRTKERPISRDAAREASAVYEWKRVQVEREKICELRKKYTTYNYQTSNTTQLAISKSKAILPPIPKMNLEAYLMQLVKQNNGNPPSMLNCEREAKKHFAGYKVTRQKVRNAHKIVFPSLLPGPRKNADI